MTTTRHTVAPPPRDDLIALLLDKRLTKEKYIFLVEDSPEQRQEALRTLGWFAANPDLSFNWWDAAKLSQKLRE